MRSWMTFGLVAVLALGSGLSVRAAEEDPAPSVNQQLREIRQMLAELKQELRTENVRGAAAATELHTLNERVGQLERQVTDLINARGSAVVRNYYDPRRSNYAAGSSPAVPGAVANRGFIHVENRYSVPATVSINGTGYTVQPFQSLNVEGMPAGVFTYEVMADGFGLIQPQQARTLLPGGSHNIYINPPVVAALP